MLQIELRNATRAKIIRAVQGQLSDGMWENTAGIDKYWVNFEIIGTTLTVNTSYNSGFHGRDEEWVRSWFARRLKAVVVDEVGNYNKANPTKGWSRDNMEISQYISYHNDVTVSECYECYDFLKGRQGHTYAFQQEDNKKESKDYKTVVEGTFINFANDHYYRKDSKEYEDFKNSVIDFFYSQRKDFMKSGSFDKQKLEDIKNRRSDIYYISWPTVGAAAAILKDTYRRLQQDYLDYTAHCNLTMSPEDCIRAAYIVDLRERLFRNIEWYLTTGVIHCD